MQTLENRVFQPTFAPSELTVCSQEQTILAFTIAAHEHPRAFTSSLIAAAHWNAERESAVVTIEGLAYLAGRSAGSGSRWKGRTNGADIKEGKHRSRIFEAVEATSRGTIFRLSPGGQRLLEANQVRMTQAIGEHRLITGSPLLTGRSESVLASQPELEDLFGVEAGEADAVEREVRSRNVSYAEAAQAAGVVGGVQEQLFSMSLRYWANTDHSVMNAVAQAMTESGTASVTDDTLARAAGLSNKRYIGDKITRIKETRLWTENGGGWAYTGRALALRAAWERMQEDAQAQRAFR